MPPSEARYQCDARALCAHSTDVSLTVLLATIVALRCSSGSLSAPSFPSWSRDSGMPFAPPGPRKLSFPGLCATKTCSDFYSLVSVPPLGWNAIPLGHDVCLLRDEYVMNLVAAWPGSPLSRRGRFSRGSAPISQVPRLPLDARATLPDPGGRHAPRLRGTCRIAFTLMERARRPHQANFGALSRGPFARCVRFAGVVADVHATLATGRPARPYPGGTCTRWAASSSFRSCYTVVLPSSRPKLRLAQSMAGLHLRR